MHTLLLRSLTCAVLLAATATAHGQVRVQQTLNTLPNLSDGHGSFADIDGDGDTDFLLTGDRGGTAFSQMYAYTDTTLRATETTPEFAFKYYRTSTFALRAVRQGDSAWGDIDGDGRPDLILAGLAGNPVTDVYINRTEPGGAFDFFRLQTALPGVFGGAVAMAPAPPGGVVPFVFLCGTGAGGQPTTALFAYQSGAFARLTLPAPNLTSCDAEWGDYDGDGDADLALSGNANGVFFTAVYRNDGGSFSQLSDAFEATAFGSVSWGDYDGDGDLDLLTTGGVLDPFILRGVTRLYRNDAGSFTRAETSLPGVVGGEARFLNFDGDAFADVALAGEARILSDAEFGIYRGDGTGSFTADDVPGELSASETGLPLVQGFYRAGFAIGDYNQDGDDDVVVTGLIESVRVWEGLSFVNKRDLPRTYFIKSARVVEELAPSEYPGWRPPDNSGGN